MFVGLLISHFVVILKYLQ